MRKILLVVICLCLILPFPCDCFGISAENAVLMDADSGDILFNKNGEKKCAPASLTKLMTALCVYDCVTDWDCLLTVSQNAANTEGSSMYLKAGDRVSIRTLLYGLLLESGNDAAVALAEFCDGNINAFVKRMNEKATALGLSDTHFENPTGLPNDNHYSTAKDIAVLLSRFSDNDFLLSVSGTKNYSAEGYSFTKHNKLLWKTDNCIGGKTGYTKAAGRCLASICLIRGRRFIVVTLNAPDDWTDHQNLYSTAENCFVRTVIYPADTYFYLPIAGENRTALVATDGNMVVYVPRYLSDAVHICFDAPQFIYTDLSFGKQIGTAHINAGNVTVCSAPVYLCERRLSASGAFNK